MPQTVYLVDASIYIFRAYFAIPDEWHCPEGFAVNAVYGYARFLLKLLQKTNPAQIVVAYDESLGSCFRNDIYPEYKASRVLPDEALAFQLEACKLFSEAMGIASLASERYEADDIIATFAGRAQKQGVPVSIVSRDKDLGQLIVGEQDHLWDFAADQRIFRKDFFQHFAVQPAQMVDYLALVGDSVDDIPGVPGIGKKTAASLLQQFNSVEGLYRNPEAVADSGIRGARGIVEKLELYREQIAMAQALVRLEHDVPIGRTDQWYWQPPSMESVQCFLEQFGLADTLQGQLEQCRWWTK